MVVQASIQVCKYIYGWKHTKGEPLFTKKGDVQRIL
jgi:hypothetical protein